MAWRRQCTGAQAVHRSRGRLVARSGVVGERSIQRGSHPGRDGGADGSANAGMSSVKADEKSAHRKPEGSYGRVIRVGLGGPKPRPRGVGDGQTVSIPSPPGRREAMVTRPLQVCVPTGQGAFPKGRSGDHGQSNTPGVSRQEKPMGERLGARTANRHWWVGINVPRWAREPSSRNSAISPRNFGRRGAPARGPQ
jgi:hypothetical protein